MNRGDTVWVRGFAGPKSAEFVERFPPANGNMTTEPSKEGKVVVLFHGTPEVFDAKDVVSSKAECYADAIRLALDEIEKQSRVISQYRADMKE